MKCQTHYCRNNTRGGRKLCPKCQSRKWREEHPMEAAYLNLKHNSKRRGKVFALSFEEFRSFAIRTGYVRKKGKQAESFHIDRIDESKGYYIGNLQVLTNSQNVKKFLKWSNDEHGKPVHFTTATYTPQPEVAGVPF